MREWKEYKIGEIAYYVNRGVSPSYVDDGGLIILNQKCIRNGKIDFTFSKQTSASKNYTLEKKLEMGDVLINSTGVGTAGRVGFLKVEKGCYVDTHVSIVRLNKKIALPEFVFYNLSWREEEIESYAEGSTGQIELAREKIKDIEINLPPLPEQTIIAKVLSSLDDKINLLHRQNKTLEQLAETLFRQWFVEEAEESWVETTLEKHTEVFRGLSYKGSGLTEMGLGLPMHNLNSVHESGGYKYEGIKFYNGEYRERHLVTVGDIIVTNTEQGHELRLIGFPAIVPDYYGNKGLFSQHIYKLIPLEGTYLTREFIYYLLMVPAVREQITGATNGSTVNMLAIDGLQRPEFKLPPKEKVVQFTSIVKDYWIKRNVNQNQIRTLTQLRDALLPKLMSGEVRVKMN